MRWQFPDGPFRIRMVRGVFWGGRRIEKGTVLRVPQDISRATAIRWCTRRRPFAVLAEPPKRRAEAPPADALPAGEPEAAPDVPEGEIDVSAHEEPGLSIPKPPDIFESLSYRQLQGIAKERGIKSFGRTRDELIAALRGE
mgnify:CR=1 FL=1